MNIREKISLLNEEKTKRTEEIKNKYRKQISAISGERHLLEIQLQQYPLQIKNIKGRTGFMGTQRIGVEKKQD